MFFSQLLTRTLPAAPRREVAMRVQKVSLLVVLPLIAIGVLLVTAPPPAAQQAKPNTVNLNGLWDAVVIVGNVQIPFRYELAVNGNQAQGFFFEGDKRIGSSSGSFINGQLRLDYEHLNTVLLAHLQGDQLVGAYGEARPGVRPLEIRARRFVPAKGMANPPQVPGDWIMSRVQAERT